MIDTKELQVGDIFTVEGYGEPLALIGWRWSIWFEIETVSFLTLSEYHERRSKIAHREPFTIDPKSGDPRAVHPILISEDWLKRLGFNEVEGAFNNAFERESVILLESPMGWYVMCGDGEVNERPMRFVHQLQNLYFALTGEELTINQPA